jgi:hypothetical protein
VCHIGPARRRLQTYFFFPPLLFFAARLRLAADRRLFTVAAAIRFAVFALRPRPVADFLIFSYIRLFFAPFTPLGGIGPPHSTGDCRLANRQSQSAIGNRQSNRQSAIPIAQSSIVNA